MFPIENTSCFLFSPLTNTPAIAHSYYPDTNVRCKAYTSIRRRHTIGKENQLYIWSLTASLSTLPLSQTPKPEESVIVRHGMATTHRRQHYMQFVTGTARIGLRSACYKLRDQAPRLPTRRGRRCGGRQRYFYNTYNSTSFSHRVGCAAALRRHEGLPAQRYQRRIRDKPGSRVPSRPLPILERGEVARCAEGGNRTAGNNTMGVAGQRAIIEGEKFKVKSNMIFIPELWLL